MRLRADKHLQVLKNHDARSNAFANLQQLLFFETSSKYKFRKLQAPKVRREKMPAPQETI